MTSASAIDEVVAALHAVIGELDDAGHATNDAAGKAGEALTRATTLGRSRRHGGALRDQREHREVGPAGPSRH